MSFKITNRLKIIHDNFKFNGDFKSHITVGRTPEEHLAFPENTKSNDNSNASYTWTPEKQDNMINKQKKLIFQNKKKWKKEMGGSNWANHIFIHIYPYFLYYTSDS